MIIGPDEFMAVAFPNLDLTKEMPAISRPIQDTDGKWVFPAEPYSDLQASGARRSIFRTLASGR